ncbi:adenosylcobinamide-GDP ribazoletransferase [Geobacter sp. DSM 9736]|uniref:adenosylcobinamide-GDP ribazoletransferase n=1 Tax=Geobacter sp. DSM 9736 TaxID=1277350 RepID=UPI000B510153|nr:adenosylcobinamide-GDP ribazoletransferase [Geobacter sp. DSM 9736]SNB46990.1 cobalamin-5'-phosphate synthase [Geobacter sp. DSM 9736]
MRLYFVALQFLTIVPIPFPRRWQEDELGRSMAFFPLAGLTIGALLAGTDYLIEPWFPGEVVDVLLIALLSAVTGGLHLDGLADVCDGLAARGGRERFLAVMKDPAIGAVGAVGLVIGLLLKYQALSFIPQEVRREALFCFPMLARYSQVQLTVGAQRARSDGLGALFVGGAGPAQLFIAYALTVSIMYLLLGGAGIVISIVSYLFTWLAKLWFHRRLGGITGDVIGCVSEFNEMLCLLAILVWAGRIYGS